MLWAGSSLHQRREKLGRVGDVLLREESGPPGKIGSRERGGRVFLFKTFAPLFWKKNCFAFETKPETKLDFEIETFEILLCPC
jgi:hypothetical protein